MESIYANQIFNNMGSNNSGNIILIGNINIINQNININNITNISGDEEEELITEYTTEYVTDEEKCKPKKSKKEK